MSLPPFQLLLDDHGRSVMRFLTATVGPDEAEDCFQETALSALRAYPRLAHGRNLRSWLFTIAHRKALDALRARSRRAVPVEHLPEPATEERRPGDSALWAQVRSLPPKQRTAIAHRFVSDLPFSDVGVVMGVSEEAARRSVHEGLKKLREVAVDA